MRRSVSALWLVLAMSVRVSPLQSLLCLAEAAGKCLMALNPLLFGLFVAGALHHDKTPMVWAIAGIVASTSLNIMLQSVGVNARMRQNTDIGFAFDVQVAEISASIATLDHLEAPEYLDKLQILRDNSGALTQAFNGLVNTINNLAWAATSIVVAVTADWRLILLALFGIPRLLAVRWTVRWDKQSEEDGGQYSRLGQSLLDLTAQPAAGAETRVFGLQSELRRQTRAAVRAWRAPVLVRAQRYAALEAAAGTLYFGAAVAIIGWLTHDALRGAIPIQALVVAISVVGSLQNISQVFVGGFQMVSTAIRNTGRFLWLRDYAAGDAAAHSGTAAPPDRLREGIRLEGLRYRYHGADRDSLAGVDLELPAGAVVAVVGENGAGKSTLVKLLGGMYAPTAGRVLIDGNDLADMDPAAWRARMSGAFQDHANIEFLTWESVGAGDLTRIGKPAETMRALRDGAAVDVLTALPRGLDTQLGTTWPGGVELSGGQWQRLAIARGMMRPDPLLLVLDEPTSALDAATEHELFERYAAAAREAGGRGAVTLLVTHRFSTVAAADLVVVLEHGRVAEVGSHTDLIAAGGAYAELYDLQARGYR